MSNCLICSRIELIKKNRNPFFVKELETGYVVIGDHQTYMGYNVFLCKHHVGELHELPQEFRNQFLLEMATVAQAVYLAFKPDKLNYKLLGNTNKHLHWHLFPRRQSDQKPLTAIWAVDKSKRSYKPTVVELDGLKNKLQVALEGLLKEKGRGSLK